MKSLRLVLKKDKIIAGCVYALAIVMVSSQAAAAAPQFKKITFEDIKPSGFHLDECWFGVGIDHNQKVYLGLSDRYGPGIDDVAIFRYDTKTGKREFLATTRQISQSKGNLQPGESIAKIHDTFKEHNGRMYFSTHDFHEPGGEHRGGHFYEYDLTTQQFDDLSRHDPGGISIPGQGIHRFVINRPSNTLVGVTYPDGDIVAYDLNAKRTTKYNAAENTSQQAGILGAGNGKIYFAYAGSNKSLYMINLSTGAIRRTGSTVAGSMHSADVLTRDGKTAYTTDSQNNVYRFNVAGESLARIGSLPSDTGKISAHALSNDEKSLYLYARDGNEGLFEMNLSTNAIRRLSGRPDGLVTGGNVIDDQGRLYACFHGDNGAGLYQISGIDTSVPCQGGGCGTTPSPKIGPCHALDSKSTIPSNWGAAYNVHSAQKELLITAQCEADRTDTEIGSGNAPLYVYHSGWGWNGSRWVPQSYACETDKIANAWCVGKAKGVVPAGIPWFVGYTCFWNGSAWKCGCRDAACAQSYWQLQGINR